MSVEQYHYQPEHVSQVSLHFPRTSDIFVARRKELVDMSEIERPHYPKNLYPQENYLELADKGWGAHLVLPRHLLTGIQTREETSKAKTKKAAAAYKQEGIGFLYRTPIFVCALPVEQGMILAIVDGHHRRDQAGYARIFDLPSVVFTSEETAEILNRSGRTLKRKPFTNATVRQYLEDSMAEALESESRINPYTQPINIVEGVHTLEQLTNRFPRFSQVKENGENTWYRQSTLPLREVA